MFKWEANLNNNQNELFIFLWVTILNNHKDQTNLFTGNLKNQIKKLLNLVRVTKRCLKSIQVLTLISLSSANGDTKDSETDRSSTRNELLWAARIHSKYMDTKSICLITATFWQKKPCLNTCKLSILTLSKILFLSIFF